MNSAAAYPWAEADAARWGSSDPCKARGTHARLAAAPHLLPPASAGQWPSSPLPRPLSPALRPVAASTAWAAEALGVIRPANLLQEPPWSANTPKKSSSASASNSKKASRWCSSVARKACRRAAQCSAGRAVIAISQLASARRVSLAIITGPNWPSQRRRMRATRRPGAWPSMPSAGIWGSYRRPSPSGLLWRLR